MIKVLFSGFSNEFRDSILGQLSRSSTLEQIQEVTKNDSTDINFHFNFEKKRGALPSCFNVLILWEPQSVMPWQYRSSVINKFDLTIPMSPWRAERLNLQNWAFHPGKVDALKLNENVRVKNLVMINAAKFSANSASNYGLRRKISKAIHKNGYEYDLFGQNWNMQKSKEFRERIFAIRKEMGALKLPNLIEAFSDFAYKYPEYRGACPNKFTELAKYRYALIIENESDWVTEKLFDALSAGCVPIFIGPNISKFTELAECIISLEPLVESVINFLQNSNEDFYIKKKNSVDQLKYKEAGLANFQLEKISEKIAEMTLNSYLSV